MSTPVTVLQPSWYSGSLVSMCQRCWIAQSSALWQPSSGIARANPFVPHGSRFLDRDTMRRLYAQTALPTSQVAHRFPVSVEREGRPGRLTKEGWSGTLPESSVLPPRFAWILRPDASFIHREVCFESSHPARWPYGNLGMGQFLRVAAQALFFLRELYRFVGVAESTVLSCWISVKGTRGRGFAWEPFSGVFGQRPDFILDQDELEAGLAVPLLEVYSSPVDVAVSLTAELIGQASMELANDGALRRHLSKLHQHDASKGDSSSRELGFLDDWKEATWSSETNT